MTYQTLSFESKRNIATITFCRPKARNAINEIMIVELEEVLTHIENFTDLRVLILTGAGKYFMAGGDIRMIKEGLKQPYEFFLLHDRLTKIGLRIERLKIPVIAAINGPALGGGLELALACDFRVMARTAHLALPEVDLGIMPGSGGTARLVRTVGREESLFIELTGKHIDAEEAEKIGLVGWVVADAKVLSVANELAKQIKSKAPVSVSYIKRAVNLAEDMPLEAAVDYCQYVALSLAATKDCHEGINAFLEKRKPKWRGR